MARTGSKMIWLRERERDSGKRETLREGERERGIKTERQAVFYGFNRKKISAFCLTFLDFPWPHNLPLK